MTLSDCGRGIGGQRHEGVRVEDNGGLAQAMMVKDGNGLVWTTAARAAARQRPERCGDGNGVPAWHGSGKEVYTWHMEARMVTPSLRSFHGCDLGVSGWVHAVVGMRSSKRKRWPVLLLVAIAVALLASFSPMGVSSWSSIPIASFSE